MIYRTDCFQHHQCETKNYYIVYNERVNHLFTIEWCVDDEISVVRNDRTSYEVQW